MRQEVFSAFITVLLFVSGSALRAQDDSIRVRVFDGSELPTPASRAGSYDDHHYVRLNLYLVARGAFTVGYENILHDKHAVAIDAGFTYRDFIYEFSFDEGFASENVEATPGHYLELAYKFYPNDYQDFDETIYLSPGFITRSYNVQQEVETYDGFGSYQTQPVDRSYSMREGYLRLGFVSEGRIFDDLILDLYCGFGFRTIRANVYDIKTLPNGADDIVTSEETRSVPAVYLGTRFGFTF